MNVVTFSSIQSLRYSATCTSVLSTKYAAYGIETLEMGLTSQALARQAYSHSFAPPPLLSLQLRRIGASLTYETYE